MKVFPTDGWPAPWLLWLFLPVIIQIVAGMLSNFWERGRWIVHSIAMAALIALVPVTMAFGNFQWLVLAAWCWPLVLFFSLPIYIAYIIYQSRSLNVGEMSKLGH